MSFQSSNSLTRRELLAGMGASLALGGAPRTPGNKPMKSNAQQESTAGQQYDMLIRGGRVVDPSQDLDAVRDVAIAGGKIAKVESTIPASQAREVINADGKIVTPGLIDIHTHVFPYVGPYGIEPDPYCLRRGVTSVVDAGTSGCFAFPAFRKFIIERAATRVRSLLHVVSIGMIAGGTPNMGELEDLRYCVPKLAVEAANKNRDLVAGFKIRFSKGYTGSKRLRGDEARPRGRRRSSTAPDDSYWLGVYAAAQVAGADEKGRRGDPFLQRPSERHHRQQRKASAGGDRSPTVAACFSTWGTDQAVFRLKPWRNA